MKILVTGANGFLGAHVVKQCLKKNYDVVATGRLGIVSGRIKYLAPRYSGSFATLDLRNDKEMGLVLTNLNPDIVINCAAYGVNYLSQDTDTAININIVGTLNLLLQCEKLKIKRFVHIGSCFEYGDSESDLSEEDCLNPTAIYGATKASSSILIKQQSMELDLEVIILRPFGIWGPLEGPHRLVPQIVSACLNRKYLNLTDCTQVRDISYVEDMANWIVNIGTLEYMTEYTIVNIGSGVGTILRDFVLKIANILNGQQYMKFGKLPHRPREMMRLVANNKIQQDLIGPLHCTSINVGVNKILKSLETEI